MNIPSSFMEFPTDDWGNTTPQTNGGSRNQIQAPNIGSYWDTKWFLIQSQWWNKLLFSHCCLIGWPPWSFVLCDGFTADQNIFMQLPCLAVALEICICVLDLMSAGNMVFSSLVTCYTHGAGMCLLPVTVQTAAGTAAASEVRPEHLPGAIIAWTLHPVPAVWCAAVTAIWSRKSSFCGRPSSSSASCHKKPLGCPQSTVQTAAVKQQVKSDQWSYHCMAPAPCASTHSCVVGSSDCHLVKKIISQSTFLSPRLGNFFVFFFLFFSSYFLVCDL